MPAGVAACLYGLPGRVIQPSPWSRPQHKVMAQHRWYHSLRGMEYVLVLWTTACAQRAATCQVPVADRMLRHTIMVCAMMAQKVSQYAGNTGLSYWCQGVTPGTTWCYRPLRPCAWLHDTCMLLCEHDTEVPQPQFSSPRDGYSYHTYGNECTLSTVLRVPCSCQRLQRTPQCIAQSWLYQGKHNPPDVHCMCPCRQQVPDT